MKDGDLISRQAVINKIAILSNEQGNKLVEAIKDIPSAEKTDGYLITEIDKLPSIKVGNSNSPTVKYCIDEVLLYDLLEHHFAEFKEKAE